MDRILCTFDDSGPTTEFIGSHPVYRTTAQPGQVERSATREYYVTTDSADRRVGVIDWQLSIQYPGPISLYLVTEEKLYPGRYNLIALGDVLETIIDDPDDTLETHYGTSDEDDM